MGHTDARLRWGDGSQLTIVRVIVVICFHVGGEGGWSGVVSALLPAALGWNVLVTWWVLALMLGSETVFA